MKKFCFALLIVLFSVTMAFAKVNINTATADELAGLAGIGKVKAEAIVGPGSPAGSITWSTPSGVCRAPSAYSADQSS